MAANPDQYLPLWYQALESEIGIYVATNERRLLVNALYATRQKAEDPELQEIMIFQPNDGRIFMVRKSVELES